MPLTHFVIYDSLPCRPSNCPSLWQVYCATCCNRKCKLKYLEKEARVCVICFDSINRGKTRRLISDLAPNPLTVNLHTFLQTCKQRLRHCLCKIYLQHFQTGIPVGVFFIVWELFWDCLPKNSVCFPLWFSKEVNSWLTSEIGLSCFLFCKWLRCACHPGRYPAKTAWGFLKQFDYCNLFHLIWFVEC